MNRLVLLMALSSGVTVTAVAWVLWRPPRYLHRRVGPYLQVARSRLARSTEPVVTDAMRPLGSIRSLFQPVIETIAGVLPQFGASGDGALARRLRHSGLYPDLDAEERVVAYRRRSLTTAAVVSVAVGMVGWQSAGPLGLVAFTAGGFGLGTMLARGRIDRAITARRRRIRAELYTVNQILAMRARAGGGVTDALRHVARRSHGAVAGELSEILGLVRSGIPLTEALRRAADTTPEPATARLYRSLAVAQERGVDLADTLLALAKDLRAAKRDHATTQAAKQRLYAVVPIVVVLAPIAIAFMAAPLPSLIFGNGAAP